MRSTVYDAGIGISDVELAAAGDEVAFGRLIATYQDVMSRVAYVIAGDRSLAEDATQTAWVIAWWRLGSIRDPSSVRGWLVSVVANEARQLLRRRGRVSVVEIDPHVAGSAINDPATGI